MDATEWLEKFEPTFASLPIAERDAIKDFALLWSLFEGTVLNYKGSAGEIIKAVRSLRAQKGLPLASFNSAMVHFRRRYHDGVDFTPEFHALRFRRPDRTAKGFVSNTTTDEADILAGLLIIIFRLRNNLFHETKWSYSISGQFDNFRHANSVLMKFMELHR